MKYHFFSLEIRQYLRNFYAYFYCILENYAKILLDFTREFIYNMVNEEGGVVKFIDDSPKFGRASQEGRMIVNGPQNIYNALPNLENQNFISRPEVNRNLGAGFTPSVDEETQTEEQNQNFVQKEINISLQEIKDLSDIYNAYQSYVNQIDASNRLIGRVSYGSGGSLDLIGG